jgi:hypothetical protein
MTTDTTDFQSELENNAIGKTDEKVDEEVGIQSSSDDDNTVVIES